MMPLWAPPPLWDEVSFRLTRGSKASLERVSQYDYVLGKGASIYDVRKIFGFPPCHCHKSADFVRFTCFLGTPSPHPLRTSHMEAP